LKIWTIHCQKTGLLKKLICSKIDSFSLKLIPYRRGSEFIRLPCPYRTVPFSARDRFGRPDSVPYFFDHFACFCLKARTLPRFKFHHFSVLTPIFRISANRTVPKHWPFFVISMLKILIWWNLLEKREAFLYEKALKTDICAVRFALITVFSFEKRNF
jgi:hypothetical protein